MGTLPKKIAEKHKSARMIAFWPIVIVMSRQSQQTWIWASWWLIFLKLQEITSQQHILKLNFLLQLKILKTNKVSLSQTILLLNNKQEDNKLALQDPLWLQIVWNNPRWIQPQVSKRKRVFQSCKVQKQRLIEQ